MCSFAVLAVVGLLPVVLGHGRLVEPPSRASMWRYGFNNPADYDDNQGYCGGLQVMQRNGNRCGICGDPYNAPRPRAHEAGGKYGNGIIVRNYRRGQTIEAKVQLTANHKGYFEFRICPVNNPRTEATEQCLQRNILRVEGSGTRYVLPSSSPQDFVVRVHLPSGLVCSHCVFQWQYVGGNNWGRCPDGTGRLGCGPQETFRACADISIS